MGNIHYGHSSHSQQTAAQLTRPDVALAGQQNTARKRQEQEEV